MKQRSGASDGSVIDQDVGASEGLLDTACEVLDGSERGQVADDRAASTPTLTNLPGSSFERLKGSTSDDRSSSQLRKPAGDGSADPLPATGDNSDLFMEYAPGVCHK